jgi:signal transduction histidine kinase
LSIVQASKEIGEGKLDVRLPTKRSDELGALASAINQMATGLSGNLQRIRALREIDMAIASTLNLREVLNVLLEKIDLALPYAAATVRLFNKESGLLEPVACRNLDEKEWKEAGGKAGRGPANAVFESKAPVMISNVQTDPRVRDLEFFRRHGLVSYLGVPLVVKDEVLGVLSFYTKEEHRFSNEEVEFLTTLAGQAAIAIHNSQLYEKTKSQAVELERANEDLKRREEIQKLLKELSQDITSLDIDSLLRKLTEKVREILKVDVSDVRVSVEGLWKLIGITGIDPNLLTSTRSGTGRGRAGWILKHRQPLVIPDLTRSDFPTGTTLQNLALRGYLGVPLLSTDGEVIGVLRALSYEPRDFTQEEVDLLQQLANGAAIALENARLLEQTKKQAVELDKANKVKDEFLGFVSHELRTPVNAVLGYTTMMQDGMFGKIGLEQERILAKVLSCSDDLLGMIDSLLQATRIGAGAVKMETEEVALVPFLDELRVAYDIPLDKELKLNWDYPSQLPVTKTDREKLKHILRNLINNAVKYSDRGNVDISVRVKEGSGEGRLVEFKVSDTGVGIAKESLPVIFEMFRQVEGLKNGSRGGVGLGLHIVKRFTELLGGEIDVQSEPGKGSTFTVKIPLEELVERLGSAGKPHSELGKVR